MCLRAPSTISAIITAPLLLHHNRRRRHQHGGHEHKQDPLALGHQFAEHKLSPRTTLFAAVAHNHVKEAKNVLEGEDAGIADVNCRDAEGETALHKAAYINNTTVSKYLIQMNADLDAQDEEGDTPLHIAADNNHTAFAELVLAAGAKVDVKNKEGRACRSPRRAAPRGQAPP